MCSFFRRELHIGDRNQLVMKVKLSITIQLSCPNTTPAKGHFVTTISLLYLHQVREPVEEQYKRGKEKKIFLIHHHILFLVSFSVHRGERFKAGKKKLEHMLDLSKSMTCTHYDFNCIAKLVLCTPLGTERKMHVMISHVR